MISSDVAARDDLIQVLWLYTGRHTERQLTTAQRELLYDIAWPDGDRWWRCAACDHAANDHRQAREGTRIVTLGCEVCPCRRFENKTSPAP